MSVNSYVFHYMKIDSLNCPKCPTKFLVLSNIKKKKEKERGKNKKKKKEKNEKKKRKKKIKNK